MTDDDKFFSIPNPCAPSERWEKVLFSLLVLLGLGFVITSMNMAPENRTLGVILGLLGFAMLLAAIRPNLFRFVSHRSWQIFHSLL